MKRYFISLIQLSLLFAMTLNGVHAMTQDEDSSKDIIDHMGFDPEIKFQKKLSLDGAIKTSLYNLASVEHLLRQKPQYDELKRVLDLPDLNGIFFLNKLGINLPRGFSQVDRLFLLEILDNNNLERIWAGYSMQLSTDTILENAQGYHEFTRYQFEGYRYYSFRLENKKDCKLYAPIYFYLDDKSIIIADEHLIKKVLTNQSATNYWPQRTVRTLLHSFDIPLVSQYKKYGQGLIKHINFNHGIEVVKALNYQVTKTSKNEVKITMKLAVENNDQVSFLHDELTKLHAEVLKAAHKIRNQDIVNFIKSIKLTNNQDSVEAIAIVSQQVFEFLDLNLIASFSDILEVFPQVVFDYDEMLDRITNEDLENNPVTYREGDYKFRTDFREMDFKNSLQQDADFDTGLEIVEINQLAQDDDRLSITVRLSPYAPIDLAWQYRYLDFNIEGVNTTEQAIDLTPTCGTKPLSPAVTLDNKRFIEQTVTLPQGISHRDLHDVTTKVSMDIPQKVKKITLTKADINKTIELKLGSFRPTERFTLLSLHPSSFTYNYTHTLGGLIEVKALNKKGEQLDINGSGTRRSQYPDGLKRLRLTQYAEGKIDLLELYYVAQFDGRTDSWLHQVKTSIVKKSSAEPSQQPILKPVSYQALKDKYYDLKQQQWQPLAIDDFFESDLANWPKAQAGPFEVYLEEIAQKWHNDIRLKFYIKSPFEPIFAQTLNSFELIIDQVTLSTGEIIKRPTSSKLKDLGKNSNQPKLSTSGPYLKWYFSADFRQMGERSSDHSTAYLGIDIDLGKFKSLKARAILTLPEELTTVTVEQLFVGDIIKTSDVEYRVEKYQDGQFHLRLNKGKKNLIQLRAKNTKDGHYVELRTELAGDILMIEPLAEQEQYEFIIATKNHSSEYLIEF